jgi:hypothetical protein
MDPPTSSLSGRASALNLILRQLGALLMYASGQSRRFACAGRMSVLTPNGDRNSDLRARGLSANRDILSDYREYVVRRQRTPNTLERKLAHGLDRYGIFYCRENTRTD